MAKQRNIFVCQQCGTESLKWMGKCPGCGEWNSMVETVISTTRERTGIKKDRTRLKPQRLSEIDSRKQSRVKTKIDEFNRVLGGGIVLGSMVLIAGEPGIGKSTLMLQLAAKAAGAAKGLTALYISGEESLRQLKIRAKRLNVSVRQSKKLLFLNETDVDEIKEAIEKAEQSFPADFLVIVDSVQTLFTEDLSGAAGSVGQVRECSSRLLRMAKRLAVPVFLIGHVTKSGTIAGPKILEHMVDTVLYLEGERFGTARLLRATKNRFGATDEVGIFEMTDKGMKEIANPSKLFLKERTKKVPGSVVVATMEGTRPLLAEIQALVVPTQLAVPRRIGQGVDRNRLQLVVAILTKKLGLPLANHDVYVNVAGGLQIREPAADLGMALAILSSFKNIPLDDQLVVFGEVGLLGELREIPQAQKRAKEARRLGFTRVISPGKFDSLNQVTKILKKS